MLRNREDLLLRYIFALLLLAAAPLGAQTLPSTEVVPELPGAGRQIAIDAHQIRRAALLDRIGEGIVAIPSGVQFDLEQLVLQDRDFRPDDYFFYFTGLEAPNAWLVLSGSGNGADQEILFLPPRNPGMEQWTGKQLGPGPDAVRLTGIDDVRAMSPDSISVAVEAFVRNNGGSLFTVLRRGAPAHPLVARWAGLGIKPANIIPTVDSMRVVKDEAELAALRRAIDITTEAHKAAMRAVQPGMFEYQVEATIEYTFRNLGADRVGFPSIVGSGPNTTILHYDVNRRQVEDGDLILADIGAEWGQYTADVTRTFPVNGRFTERQKDIYNLVLGTQLAVIDAIRPGVTMRDLGIVAQEYMRLNSGDLCGAESCTRFFIHGLGHWLGMRVHDVGDYSMPLEPGMVFTLEPGIYIPGENLGVRIEDDVLVTENGCEVLSTGAPKTVEEIESLMNSISARFTRSN
jgi:Xaa-Pro aminopeptidase